MPRKKAEKPVAKEVPAAMTAQQSQKRINDLLTGTIKPGNDYLKYSVAKLSDCRQKHNVLVNQEQQLEAELAKVRNQKVVVLGEINSHTEAVMHWDNIAIQDAAKAKPKKVAKKKGE